MSETLVKERPILFSTPMVQAILEGRKTQTRRVVKPKPVVTTAQDGFKFLTIPGLGAIDEFIVNKCPYGQIGDRLWVRETWAPVELGYDYESGYCDNIQLANAGDVLTHFQDCGHHAGQEWLGRKPRFDFVYAATGQWEETTEDRNFPWKPSIHMPRKACRLELEVTGIRIERLHDITEQDAMEEGVYWEQHLGFTVDGEEGNTESRVGEFSALWERINGAESWDANPWVWVVEFKPLKL